MSPAGYFAQALREGCRTRAGPDSEVHTARRHTLVHALAGEEGGLKPRLDPSYLAGLLAGSASVRDLQLIQRPAVHQKGRDVVGLYLAPPGRALVLCIDEKSQIQALDLLPCAPDRSNAACTTMPATAQPASLRTRHQDRQGDRTDATAPSLRRIPQLTIQTDLERCDLGGVPISVCLLKTK
jgi:hypothetical protein